MNISGIVDHHQVWNGEVLITGDVVIPAGVRVTIGPGSSVTFAPESDFDYSRKETMLALFGSISPLPWKRDSRKKCHLVVEGVLEAEGTSQDRVEIGNEEWGGGILVSGTGTVQLSRCRINGATFGIGHGGTAAIQLTGNEIQNCVYGVLCFGEADLRNNTIHSNLCGIGAHGGNSRISENIIRNNSGAGIVHGAGSLAIRGNTITENKTGICQKGGVLSAIEENQFSRNQLAVYVEDTGCCDIDRNQFVDNQDVTVYTAGKNEVLRVHANVFKDTPIALDCNGLTEAEIADNSFLSVVNGIRFSGDTKGVLRRNSMTDIKETAFLARNHSSAIVEDNVFKNVLRGVEAVEEAHVKVEKNTIQAVAGVIFRESARGTIERNIIEGETDSAGTVTGMVGVEVAGMSGAEIVANRITNSRMAIRVGGTAEVRIEGNEIHSSSVGIQLGEHARGSVVNNTVAGT